MRHGVGGGHPARSRAAAARVPPGHLLDEVCGRTPEARWDTAYEASGFVRAFAASARARTRLGREKCPPDALSCQGRTASWSLKRRAAHHAPKVSPILRSAREATRRLE